MTVEDDVAETNSDNARRIRDLDYLWLSLVALLVALVVLPAVMDQVVVILEKRSITDAFLFDCFLRDKGAEGSRRRSNGQEQAGGGRGEESGKGECRKLGRF